VETDRGVGWEEARRIRAEDPGSLGFVAWRGDASLSTVALAVRRADDPGSFQIVRPAAGFSRMAQPM
jgi:hypothetical protein